MTTTQVPTPNSPEATRWWVSMERPTVETFTAQDERLNGLHLHLAQAQDLSDVAMNHASARPAEPGKDAVPETIGMSGVVFAETIVEAVQSAERIFYGALRTQSLGDGVGWSQVKANRLSS